MAGSGVTDWRDAQAYRRLRAIDRAGLMWEWLRRDADYVAWHMRASTATRGAGPLPLADAGRWGFTFAEDPERSAPDARIIWHADLDPGAVGAAAAAAAASDPDAIDAALLSPWLSAAVDEAGVEHVVLSDGWQHIRLDIEHGSLLAGSPVVLHYRLAGLIEAEPKLLPLQQLVALVRHRRFLRTLIAPDIRMTRHLLALRVHDALAAGASQREIAEVLFGSVADLEDRTDSLRSRVRRLARESRRLASGGWRTLMRRGR